MYTSKQPVNITFGTRVGAFFIIGFCGLLVGWTLGGLLFFLDFGHALFGEWYFAIVFAIIGFIFPRKTERLWSPFWVFVLKYLTP
jgi:hypothetical protein